MPGTRKLGRPTAHRNAMLRGMVTYLIENGSIETTLTRAKEVRSLAEKMITLGKRILSQAAVRLLHSSPRKTLLKSSLTRSLRLTLTETVVILRSTSSDRAAATLLKWL